MRSFTRDRNDREENREGFMGNVTFFLDLYEWGRERNLCRKIHTNIRRWDQVTEGNSK